MGARHSLPLGSITIEADAQFPAVAVQVSHLDLTQREEHVLREPDAYRVDLCITPRLPARMRFDRWLPHRFERPGRIFVVPPGESLAVWNDLGRERVVVAHLFTQTMGRWLEAPIAPSDDQLDKSIAIASPAIEQVMLRLCDEACCPGFASEIMIEGLAMQLAVVLQRYYGAGLPRLPAGGLTPWRLRRIDERLAASPAPPPLSELANLCGLSVRQLARGFRASRGQSIGHYVAQHRIERAKEALVRDASIKAVAGRMGFSSTAAFSAAFRRTTGVSPTEFRRLVA